MKKSIEKVKISKPNKKDNKNECRNGCCDDHVIANYDINSSSIELGKEELAIIGGAVLNILVEVLEKIAKKNELEPINKSKKKSKPSPDEKVKIING